MNSTDSTNTTAAAGPVLSEGLGPLPPQRSGQANSMLITAGPGVDAYECGHWESPAVIQRRIDAAVAEERARWQKACGAIASDLRNHDMVRLGAAKCLDAGNRAQRSS